jgi:hypothetical protein
LEKQDHEARIDTKNLNRLTIETLKNLVLVSPMSKKLKRQGP